MPWYKWNGDGEYQDNRNSRVVEPGDVVELDEYVGGPNPGLVEVDPPKDDGEDSEESESEDEDVDVPVAEKDYDELRQMAKEADTDEINGRSGKDEIIAYFKRE